MSDKQEMPKVAQNDTVFGNAASMREALELVKRNANCIVCPEITCPECGTDFQMRGNLPPHVIEAVNAALAKPPRNCDIGTAEEQLDRYGLFCQNKCPICDNRHSCHICGERYRMKCMMKWTQMPYNESEMEK